ncbi:MAG: hypothetical protein KF716_11380 [Anaerolineae bacterium]|nr:hypothetical protein [Anaerolineae bacterium]
MRRLTTILLVTGVLLTLVNLVMLVTLISRGGAAALSGAENVVRAQKFELVDDQGRVRAQLLITEPTTMPDGTQYAESVLFRLIDENGRPGVKIGTGTDGSGMSLAGDSERRDWSGVQILADGSASKVILTGKDGKVEQFQP